jgi:hypothetical protein
MTSSNVIAAPYDLVVQRNAAFEFYFKFKDADGIFIDLTTIANVKVEIRNVSGTLMTSYSLGDGLTVDANDSTILYMAKADSEKNIPVGLYTWDLKITATEGHAQYPLRGKYRSVNYITE